MAFQVSSCSVLQTRKNTCLRSAEDGDGADLPFSVAGRISEHHKTHIDSSLSVLGLLIGVPFFSSFSNFITTMLSLFKVSIHERWYRTTWMSKVSFLRFENCRTNCLWLSQPAAFTTDTRSEIQKGQGYVPAFVWCLSKHKGKRFILYSVKSLFSGKVKKNRLSRPLPKVSLRSLMLIIALSLSAFYVRWVTSQYCSSDLRLADPALCSPYIYLLYKKKMLTWKLKVKSSA